MKANKAAVALLMLFLVVMVPVPVLATNTVIVNGQMDSTEQWVYWFSDQTFEYKGYPNRQRAGNTLGFDCYYSSDSSNLYLYISTDDNTFGSWKRDKFMVYFDIFPYGRGIEDKAYAIEVPSSLFGGGISTSGPNWSDFEFYSEIAVGSKNGYRTFEIAIPLSQIVPDKDNVNYRSAKFLIYLENYGDYLWGEHKVINYHPDAAGGSKYWKNTCEWQQADLSALCSEFFNPQPQQYDLSTNTVGSGNIFLTPDQESYVDGMSIQVLANPDVGWEFSGWSGDLSGTTNPISLTMDSDKSVTATFTQIPYTLTVTSVGTGCTVNVSPIQQSYWYGDSVTLVPQAALGWSFSGWLGDVSGVSSPAIVTMDGNKLVVANFERDDCLFSISYSGNGAGQVLSNATGNEKYGDLIQITAVAFEGSSFSGWSGDLFGTNNPAFVTLNGNKDVIASFILQDYSIAVNIVGSGSVTKTPNHGRYVFGTTVQLEADAEAGWSFLRWNGDLTGNNNPESILLNGDKTVYAVFTQNQYSISFNTIGQGIPTITPNLASYPYGSSVQLTANPVVGWSFLSWSSNTPDIVITNPNQELTSATINGVGEITATYVQNTYDLTTYVNPAQGGYVTADISGPYHYGDVVTLTAHPSAGYSLSSWSGGGTSIGNTCSVTIHGDVSVTANFIADVLVPEDNPILSLTPSAIVGPKPDVGETFEVSLQIENATDLWGWTVKMVWDPSVLQLVAMSEGTFLNSTSPTLFVGFFGNGEALYELNDFRLIATGFSGSGTLAYFTFKVVNYGATSIVITESELFELTQNPDTASPLAHSTEGATFSITPPPPSGPSAKFTLPNGGVCKLGDLLILDASTSLPGYDNLPVGHETTNFITQYTWSIDYYNDGTIDEVLEGESVSTVIPYVGMSSVSLTVFAPDLYSPTSQDYNQTDTTVHLIQVEPIATLANIDIYTERGGTYANQTSDAYGPQEQIVIYSLVTFNDAPVVGKDVVFEIRSANGTEIFYKVARTDDNGIATIEFRLPWFEENPESAMGIWRIIATVDISEQVIADICDFEFGYLINIVTVQTLSGNSESIIFARQNILETNITLKNIRSIIVPTTITVAVYDEANVPVAVNTLGISVAAQSNTTITVSTTIPPWAFVGLGRVFVNAYTKLPSSGGVAYCPEQSKTINIIQ